jgi:hypothetical protein
MKHMASKEQQRLFDAICEIAPNLDFIQDYRPNFMKNKITSQNYEIDIFCKELNFGFEYQGVIHFKNVKKY